MKPKSKISKVMEYSLTLRDFCLKVYRRFKNRTLFKLIIHFYYNIGVTKMQKKLAK